MARWLTRVGLPRTQARILVLKVDLEFVLLRDARVLRVRLCVCLFVCTYRACPPVLLVFDLLTYLCVRVCIRVCVRIYLVENISVFLCTYVYI